MDLIPEQERDAKFTEKSNRIMEKTHEAFRPKTQCYKTSIWDETLYKAWSTIVSILLPNIKQLELSLKRFCETVNANEVVLFEKSTFLVISHFDAMGHTDDHRFEKISNIIKQFKLSCIKTNYNFKSMVVKNEYFTSYIDEFTDSTYIMVTTSSPDSEMEMISTNIKASQHYFTGIIAGE
jgi:Ras-related GTP-binding protein A/B